VGLLPLGGEVSLPRRLSDEEAVSVAGAFLESPHGQEAEVAAHIAETIISFASDYARPGVGRLRENRELPVRGPVDGWQKETASTASRGRRPGATHPRGVTHTISKERRCKSCGHAWRQSEEKKTDVNIAVRLLDDAYDDRFDTAVVISGDSDLVPPIKSVRARFPSKRLVVASPPKRVSGELRGAADAALTISDRTIRANRLPNPVITSTGIRLWAPAGWLPKP